VTCATASTFDRKDLVVSNPSGTLSIVQGAQCSVVNWTPGNGNPPVRAACPSGYIAINEIYVSGGASSLASSNLVDKTLIFANIGTNRFGLHVPELTPAATVATSNIASLSAPGATINGYSLAAGDLLLLTVQSTASQNGLWQWNGASSALTRITEFPSGAVVNGGRVCHVKLGTYAGYYWVLATPTAGITIDTSSQTWVEGGGGSSGVSEITDGSANATGNVEFIGTAGIKPVVTTAGANGIVTIEGTGLTAIVAVAGATHNLSHTDVGALIECSDSSGCAITVTDDSTFGTAWASGTADIIVVTGLSGVGTITFTTDGTASLNGSTSTSVIVALTGGVEKATLVRVAANTWQITETQPLIPSQATVTTTGTLVRNKLTELLGTAGDSCAITVPAGYPGDQIAAMLHQPASGSAASWTFTGATLAWVGGSAPTFTATNGKTDTLVLAWSVHRSAWIASALLDA
jgi:hypothetical protein